MYSTVLVVSDKMLRGGVGGFDGTSRGIKLNVYDKVPNPIRLAALILYV